jgi:prepilin-type N-terminal cleavage/methylation domain-containing protein
MLKTGIRLKGFTFVEIMMASSVLALGAVFLYQAFFVSVDAFQQCDNYLYALTFADDKIWESQDTLRRNAALGNMNSQDFFPGSNRYFNWQVSSSVIKEVKDRYKLFRIELAVDWQQGRRQSSLTRTAYLMYRMKG